MIDMTDPNSPSRKTPTQVDIENAAQKAVDYLYKIKGDCSPEPTDRIKKQIIKQVDEVYRLTRLKSIADFSTPERKTK